MSEVGQFYALKTAATQGALQRETANPDGSVAWVCYFNDLLVIRTYLTAYWNGYLNSVETLTTRALVTNAAIKSVSYDLFYLLQMCFKSSTLVA